MTNNHAAKSKLDRLADVHEKANRQQNELHQTIEERNRQMFEAYDDGNGESMMAIAHRLGVSRQMVHRIITRQQDSPH